MAKVGSRVLRSKMVGSCKPGRCIDRRLRAEQSHQHRAADAKAAETLLVSAAVLLLMSAVHSAAKCLTGVANAAISPCQAALQSLKRPLLCRTAQFITGVCSCQEK